MGDRKESFACGENVCRNFILDGLEEKILDSINLSVTASEFVAITGSNGSGKSTLLLVLAGIDQPGSGAITMDEMEITQLNEDQLAPLRNSLVGFVFRFFIWSLLLQYPKM